MMKTVLRYIFPLFALCAAVAGTVPQTPNVILILADDLGYTLLCPTGTNGNSPAFQRRVFWARRRVPPGRLTGPP